MFNRKRFDELRIERGLTYSELAHRAGYARYTSVLSRLRYPGGASMEFALRMAKALDVSPSELDPRLAYHKQRVKHHD